MANNKAKRSIPMAQPERRSSSPNPQPAAGPMPVKAHIYRALAELNTGFEKVILDLGNLKQINYFSSEPLADMHDTLCRIRAQANREFLDVMGRREAANAGHFEQLRRNRESKAGESKPPEIAPAG